MGRCRRWSCWSSAAPGSTSARTRWWPACAPRRARWPSPGDADVPVVHLGAGGAGRLAGRRGRHPGGDGGHRPVLEAGLVRAGGARASSCCWSTPTTSRSCPAARPTSATPSGWPSCSSTGCCGAASCPRPPIRELRDLTRYRKRLIQAHTAEGQRIQKTLEDAGIKLDSVASDVLGRLGPGDAGRPGRRRARPRGAGRAGQGQAAGQAPPAAPGAAGPVRRPSRAADPPGAWSTSTTWRRPIADARHRSVDRVLAPFAQARDRLDTITGVGQAGRRDASSPRSAST